MAAGKGLEFRLIIVLLAIMIGSGLFLTAVYQLASPHIEAHQAREKEKAVLKVIPGAEDYEEIEIEETVVYRGIDRQEQTAGYAIEAEGSGFVGDIVLMIGLHPEEEKVAAIEVLETMETPGLGARIEEEEFKAQFADKSFGDPFSTDEDIEVISGATLSSEAVAAIVNSAIETFQELQIDNIPEGSA